MKPESGGESRGERAAWLLVVCAATALAFWVQDGIEGLRAASERRETELERFLELRQRASDVPTHEAGRVARQIDHELSTQEWYRTLQSDGSRLRPRVVPTEAGLVVRLVEPRRGDRDTTESATPKRPRGAKPR